MGLPAARMPRYGRRGRAAARSISAANSGGTFGPNSSEVGSVTIWGRGPGAPSEPAGPAVPFWPAEPSAASAQRRVFLLAGARPPLPPLPPLPPPSPRPPPAPGPARFVKPAGAGVLGGGGEVAAPAPPPLPP